MAKVLIIDDDALIRELLITTMEGMGHEVQGAGSLVKASQAIQESDFDIVYLDVRLPDGDGLSALPGLRQSVDPPEVIIITGEGDPDGAELATRNGAWDYIEKPCSLERMTLPLTRALQFRSEKRKTTPIALHREAIIGHSPGIRACLDLVVRAAAGQADVLITGETGTGKELFARAIHENTAAIRGPFVVVDCAALPENLVESLLFGHVRGAFTGADAARGGLVKQADGETLFLDEVGELPLPIQAKFLRVLQERRFRPVGATHEETSTFRLVAATNRDLRAMVGAGTFRKDLLYRLNAMALNLPPLRSRMEDLALLVIHRLTKLGQRYHQGTKGLTPEFMDVLCSHNWPGNVRELFNVLETSVVAAQFDSTLYPHHLPVDLRVRIARETVSERHEACTGTAHALSPYSPLQKPGFPNWRDYRTTGMDDLERRYFTDLMRHTKGNRQQACELSDLKPARLYQLLSKHGILDIS